LDKGFSEDITINFDYYSFFEGKKPLILTITPIF
jgi:hypothetical protein